MSFFFGLLVIAIAILASKAVMKAAGAIWHCAGRLRSVFRKRQTIRYQSIPCRTGQPVIHLTNRESDGATLSRELRKEILTRGVRTSAEPRRLSQLDIAIEIEKREIELARLKAEKGQIKARAKTVRPDHSSVKDDRSGATRSFVPVEQLQAMRAATRLERSSPPRLQREPHPVVVHEIEQSPRQTAHPSAPVHH